MDANLAELLCHCFLLLWIPLVARLLWVAYGVQTIQDIRTPLNALVLGLLALIPLLLKLAQDKVTSEYLKLVNSLDMTTLNALLDDQEAIRKRFKENGKKGRRSTAGGPKIKIDEIGRGRYIWKIIDEGNRAAHRGNAALDRFFLRQGKGAFTMNEFDMIYGSPNLHGVADDALFRSETPQKILSHRGSMWSCLSFCPNPRIPISTEKDEEFIRLERQAWDRYKAVRKQWKDGVFASAEEAIKALEANKNMRAFLGRMSVIVEDTVARDLELRRGE